MYHGWLIEVNYGVKMIFSLQAAVDDPFKMNLTQFKVVLFDVWLYSFIR